MLGEATRPFDALGTIGDRGRRQHEMWGVAMQSIEGLIKVRLLAFGWQSGTGAPARDIDDDDWGLACDRQSNALGHQAHPGA
jgi:hypothetical protein